MKALAASLLPVLAGVAVLGLVPAALAHGEEHGNSSQADGGMDGMDGMGGGMKVSDADKPLPEDQYPPTYFAHPEHKAAIYGHIAVMVLAWVFALPAVVMLSLARSRHTLMAQNFFIAMNSVGVLLGVYYNANTPDLYPGDAHLKLGWLVTVLMGGHLLVGIVARAAGGLKRERLADSRPEERQGFIQIPVSAEAMAEHESRFPAGPYSRFSNDSGQGTEPRTESLRSHSLSSGAGGPPSPIREAHKEYRHSGDGADDDDEDLEARLPVFRKPAKPHSVVLRVARKISDRLYTALVFWYNFVDRTILILGFIALCTGIISFGRFFEGGNIFTGLAHWIKGGVFFWLGILTLGRWAGSFGDLGWAWNLRPKYPGQKWCPSAEFVESALIFFYGSTNIFLEHLGGSSSEWSAQDMEHLAITVLFIGGGLCGMLVESTKIRTLLNHTATAAAQSSLPPTNHTDEEPSTTTDTDSNSPPTHPISTNPLPALVILLLGIMMSSHTQESMISGMVHKQWGTLLTGASVARALTYVLVYLRPPRSVLPSRPPTELLAAFGLVAGGVVFMASSGDTVSGMIHYQLDAMFMYTVTMGLTALLMAWVILMVALKGWAARREAWLEAGLA